MSTTSEHSQRLAATATVVREVFLSLAKLISARTIYTHNNPTLTRFSGAFHHAVQACFEHERELQLRVEQYRLLWRDEVVYESEDRGGSIAFTLFKDGVGELTIYSSVTTAELDQLVDILKEEIHNPEPDSDVVTRMWNADFAGISYRVLDDDPTGRQDGERGAGVRLRANTFLAEDHPGLAGDAGPRGSAVADHEATSIADYLLGVVTASRPESDDAQKEGFVQDMLSTLFSASDDERRMFLEEHAEDGRRDKIAELLATALDFTRCDDPSTLENALTLVERAAGYALAESDTRTLARALDLIREAGASHPNPDIRAGMKRLEADFVDGAFLRTLGRDEDQPTEEVLGALRYLRMVGPAAVPVIIDLLHVHRRTVIHREGCDALLAIAGDRIDDVISELNVDNVHIARDAVRLLGASARGTVPPLLRELVHYPDVQVRAGALQLLAQSRQSDATPLLCVMLDDDDRAIRLHALAELERVGGIAAASKVASLCIGENDLARDRDEMTRLFEAAGRIAASDIVAHLEHTLQKRSWLRFGAQAGAGDKHLAVAALRFAPGPRADALLRQLLEDGDPDVRAAAKDAVDARGASGSESGGETT